MKKLLFISGMLTLFLFPTSSRADFCDLEAEAPTFYRTSYCETRLHGNTGLEDDVYEAMEVQLGLPSSVIDLFLTKGNAISCEEVKNVLEEKEGLIGDDRPLSIKIACDNESSNNQRDGLLNILEKVRIAYNKEKALQITQKKLELEFKESEKYWDGNLHNLVGTPFDVMTDLNLVDEVLFGSQANWTYDVFSFPEKEEEASEDETPIIPAAGIEDEPQEGEVDENEETEDQQEDTDRLNENCIPNQGSADAFPSCGNGELEVILGETCDDGNRQAGDGCSPSCVIEETGSGGLNMCIDPEAVTFQDFTGSTAEGSNEASSSGTECPPGTHPRTDASSGTASGSGGDTNSDQSSGYPGPFIGGTLKQLEENNAPACPPGQSEIEISLINGETKQACIPTETCTDFNRARNALFGEGWEQDEELAPVAYSIESLFCVNVIPWNGPQNLYNPNEGCVDCHIRGIAKSLEEALETNVTPMSNTFGAFDMSQRWGPNASFNLTIMAKSKIRAANVDTPNEPEDTERGAKAAELKNTPGEPSISTEENPSEELERKNENEERITEARQEWLKDYRMRNRAVGDMKLNQTMVPLLRQMESLFESIHENYSSMADISLRLAEKEMCQF